MRILLFILLSISCFGQIDKRKVGAILMQQTSAPSLYYDIPSAPFTTGYNRAQTGLGTAGQIRPTDLGSPAGDLDVVLTSNFTDGISFRDLGTNKFRFTTNGLYTIGGASTKGIETILTNEDIELYGLDEDTPLLVNGLLSGKSAINWISGTAPNLLTQNAVLSADFAGVLASSSTGSYGTFRYKHVRMFGTNTEGEFIYNGNTGSTFATFPLITIEDCFGTDKGRDGLQIGHTDSVYVNRFTVYDVGKTNTAQQDHLVQFIDSNGWVEYSIFDWGPRLLNISSHGITFYRCYFRFYDNAETPGFIGRTDNLTYYPTSRHNGRPIRFIECYFEDDTGVSSGSLINVQERIADIEFLDCDFDTTKSSLFQDSRAVGHINSLIGTLTTNGNEIVSLPDPAYISTTKTDYKTHGLVNVQWFLDRGLGNRTK